MNEGSSNQAFFSLFERLRAAALMLSFPATNHFLFERSLEDFEENFKKFDQDSIHFWNAP